MEAAVSIFIVLAFVFAIVLFALGIKNFGAPSWNLISAGLLALAIALMLEYMKTTNLGG